MKVERFVWIALAILSWATTLAEAKVYYVRPDGNDANSGLKNSPQGAWRSIDRGQPTILTEDISEGQTMVPVEKATQFPPKGRVRIAGSVVTYTARTATRLLGCKGAPKARKGTKVESLDWSPPAPGDTVVVVGDIYWHEWMDDLPDGFQFSVAIIRRGGKAEKPIVFRGEGFPVIDGRDRMKSITVLAPYVHLEGFDIRRGGLYALFSDGLKVLNCKIHHEGRYGLFVRYSRDVEIANNLIYDLHGAWTGAGITVGDSRRVHVHHNTVVNCRVGIRFFGRCPEAKVERNLVAWCRLGFQADHGAQEYFTSENFGTNLFWANGPIHWLHRLQPTGNASFQPEGTNHYSGLKFTPQDIHEDPKIVSWDSRTEEFLAPHLTSPCARDGEAIIGARKPCNYPKPKVKEGENLLFNPSFESGFVGWFCDAWQPFELGEAGWRIVEGDVPDGRRCVELFDNPPQGKTVGVRFHSSHFLIPRGYPVTMTFKARAEKPQTTLWAGFTFVSWQNKSGLGERFRLSTEWQTFSFTKRFADYWPQTATVSFSVSRGRVWIDAVKVEVGERASPFSPPLEIVLRDPPPGLLFPPDKPIPLEVFNRSEEEFEGKIRWSLRTPLHGEVGSGERTLKCKAGAWRSFPLPIPKGREGVFLLRYAFLEKDEREVTSGKLRFYVGRPAPSGERRSFFSATPSYWTVVGGTLLHRQYEALSRLGLGSLHLYLGTKRMFDLLTKPKFDEMLLASQKVGLGWLFTLSDLELLVGKRKEEQVPKEENGKLRFVQVKLPSERMSEERLAVWRRWVRALVERFRGKIQFYEVLNEPNVLLKGEEYRRLLLATSKEIRRADPKAHIIAGSVVNAHRGELYFATMKTPPETFDSFSFHPYHFGRPNPDTGDAPFGKMLREVKEDLKEHGHKPLVWLTEEGMGPGLEETRCIGYRLSYSAPIRQVEWDIGEILQAGYLARMYLTALGEGALGYNYHTLQGLVLDVLMTPNLALKTIHTMADLLHDSQPLGMLRLGPDFVGYLFSVGKGAFVAAIWMKDAEYGVPMPVEFSLPEGATVFAYDMLGFPLPCRKVAKGWRTEINRTVLYLHIEKTNADEVFRSLERAFSPLRTKPDRGA
ncbi:TPA: hypothetical protein EYP38_05375 [Candidatus Micrarchaeota archaeon]|nr:hypothetical protein [Candidatus Micrarchaeota archaeon]